MPDAKLLDEVVRRYPEFGEELTEFAIALAIEPCEVSASSKIRKGRSTECHSPGGQPCDEPFPKPTSFCDSGAAEARSTPADAADAPNLLSGLSRDEFRALAARLNANNVFVGKLRDRQIDSATMTPGFQRLVADELDGRSMS